MELISAVGSKSFVLLTIVSLILIASVVHATPGLVLPAQRNTGLGCIREGTNVSYECTVIDASDPLIGSTVWQGSAFSCTIGSSQISLSHARFTETINGNCGDLSAISMGVSGNEYTSRLTLLTATTEMNGTNIECTLSVSVVVGRDTLRIGAPPPAPQSVMVEVTSPSSLTVNWTAPSDTSNVRGYMFTVTGEDCGDCVNTTVSADTTSVSCSDYMVDGQTCSFGVTTVSQDCGFTNDTAATAFVVLSAPFPPSNVDLMYSQDTCTFQSALLSWMVSSLPTGYPPVQMYRVRVNNGTVMSTSGTETTLTVPSGTFSRAGTYMFNVAAVNALGEGVALAGFIVSLTSVSSSYTATMTNATLTFSLNNSVCNSTANITVYYQECADQANKNCQCPQDASFSSIEQSTSPTEALVITRLRPGVIYCYRSVVVSDGTIVGFENGQMFKTDFPEAPSDLPGARLVNNDTLTYECVDSAKGFNGGSSQTTASFNSTTGLYSVPPCLILTSLIAVIVIVVVVLIVGVSVGTILVVCLVKRCNKKADDEKDITNKTPPPPDSLYADPNSIEHEEAPGTEDQYAMVDVKGKKNKKLTAHPPGALYQDPNTIEHETAASGDTYAVVDKPKRSSKKKGGPDVVPPPSEGLTYADIDLSSKRPKPGSGRQAPQQPGEYPKEHPVEYSSVDHGNTSQL